MSNNKSQISPIPPVAYGDRFVKFITGITLPREEAEKQSHDQADGSIHTRPPSGQRLVRTSTERVLEKAEKQARLSEDNGAAESSAHDRTLSAIRSPSAERTSGVAGSTLPIVEEVGEGGSTGGRSGRSQERGGSVTPSDLNIDSGPVLGGRPPPTPPKDHPLRNKQLPSLPPAVPFMASPAPMSPALQ